jgi:ABC-type Fe3+ transport system permease subunit
VQAGDYRRAMVLSLILSVVTGTALWLLTRVGHERTRFATDRES